MPPHVRALFSPAVLLSCSSNTNETDENFQLRMVIFQIVISLKKVAIIKYATVDTRGMVCTTGIRSSLPTADGAIAVGRHSGATQNVCSGGGRGGRQLSTKISCISALDSI